jgi:hypothetical protein
MFSYHNASTCVILLFSLMIYSLHMNQPEIDLYLYFSWHFHYLLSCLISQKAKARDENVSHQQTTTVARQPWK